MSNGTIVYLRHSDRRGEIVGQTKNCYAVLWDGHDCPQIVIKALLDREIKLEEVK